MAEADGPWSVEPTLQPGAKNDSKVEHLQTLLRVHVNPNLDVDGDFGAGTEAAVRALQKRHGLPETGIVDTATWRVLLADPHSAGDGMVAGQDLTIQGMKLYSQGHYAEAIEKWRAALDAGASVGGIDADTQGLIVGNIALSYGRLGDAASCAEWAAHAIETAGSDAAKNVFQLYYFASTGKLGALDWSKLSLA